jgi:hypothetical protein
LERPLIIEYLATGKKFAFLFIRGINKKVNSLPVAKSPRRKGNMRVFFLRLGFGKKGGSNGYG